VNKKTAHPRGRAKLQSLASLTTASWEKTHVECMPCLPQMRCKTAYMRYTA